MISNICLAGNPNCGKTTLFNLLTGRTEKVGNRAGVTVESKSGRYKKNKKITVTDLPGAYSLESGSIDEKIAAEHIFSSAQAVINLVDGTNLKRSLQFTCELARLKLPMVIAVNFCDELEKNGITLDVSALKKAFNVPVVMISARKKKGVDNLMRATENARVPNSISRAEQDEFIENLSKTAVKKTFTTDNLSDKIDKILLNKYFGIPLFAVIMIAVYCLTSVIGGFFGDAVAGGVSALSKAVKKSLTEQGASAWFTGLICGAVISGVGEVLSFLPQILVLFLLLAVMEETGYLSRVAFLFDGIMEKAGLGGKSLIALGVSCGCAVSGIMTTRTVENDNSRRLTVMLTPFMPCGAKTAVFAWLSGLIFGGNPFITASLYFLSIFAVAFFGVILKRFDRFRGGGGLIMEIPVLRLPSFSGVFGALKEKTADFILKAGSVIFLVSVIVWFLQSFGIHGYAFDITDSFLFFIGEKIKYIFIPLGFGNWQCSVAVVSGAFAKEAVIQTLSMVAENSASLFSNGYSAYAFMTFILLAPPCTAALATAKRELGSRKDFWFMIGFQFSAAYFFALIINLIGYAAENFGYIFISLTFVALGIIISVITLKNRRCGGNCKICPLKDRKCRTKKVNTTI